MIELWFYSGRLGNCMFGYAFNRCIAKELNLRCLLPKGTEIAKFPLIANESLCVLQHDQKYETNINGNVNPRTVESENDNMLWLLERQFQGSKILSYDDNITIDKVLELPDVKKKWIVTLGNFEIGHQYLPYREQIKQWFTFPAIDLSKIEFFKLHSDLGFDNYFKQAEFTCITEDDIVISLRLEDYTNSQNKDRLLDYDYFKIILESKKWNNVYIITNPGSIGHNDQYTYLKEFKDYDPIIVRCYDPVMSMGFGAMFNNIAISQSTYSWWLAFLSNAKNIFFPIPITGPFSLNSTYMGTDLRLPAKEFIYVDYANRKILPEEMYLKINYSSKTWTH